MQPFLLTESNVVEALRQVIDPELGVNVVDLGLIYGVEIDDARVDVTMTLTTPGCPLHASMTDAVERAILVGIPGAEAVGVDLVFQPEWTPDRMTQHAKASLGWAG